VNRLTGEKEQVPLDGLASDMTARLVRFQDALYERALAFRDEHTAVVDTWDDFITAVGQGFASAMLCDDAACELKIKEQTTATPRVIPFDVPSEQGPCIACGRPSTYQKRILFARAY
jgi:prolyl-tRNA synthetase